ncbi:MAG: PrsW family glutamic-type intramembrane protease [Candidatus Lernaella stagnicola]|nr:PrsW family glutamic-type intramembrane protease [Candidatus Lernaella stagnicola]
MLQYTLAAALVPALFLVWFFYRADLRPEPPKVIWITFFLGVASTFAVLAVLLPVKYLFGDFEDLANPLWGSVGEAFCSAAIPEELLKFCVLFFFAARHRAFDEPMDGIVYGATASLGFAALENVLYTLSGGMVVAIMRALTAVPAHACFGAVMGYYLGQAKFRSGASRFYFLPAALIWPIVLHGLYDFPLMLANRIDSASGLAEFGMFSASMLVLILGAVWTLLLVRKLNHAQRAELGMERPARPSLFDTSRKAKPAAPAPAVATGIPVAPAPVGGVRIGPPPPVPRRAATDAWTIMMLIGGAILGTIGALLTLVAIVGVIAEPPSGGDDVLVIGCVSFMALVPSVGGVVLFVLGLRRMRK